MSKQDTILSALTEALRAPLPGKTYQYQMAPEHRRRTIQQSEQLKPAAVSLIINKTNNEPEMILIKRSEYDGPHSGQVSFPGGKQDAEDNSLMETAIRESREEIGIELNPGDCIGKLTPLDIDVSGFRVHPFLFYTSGELYLKADPGEVSYILRFPVRRLLDETVIQIHTFRFNDFEFDAPYFDLTGEIVWGATSMILSEFREIVLRIDKKNPGIFMPG